MMKKLALLLFIVTGINQAQSIDYYTKKGYIAEGYDVVAYFSEKAVKGDSKFKTVYDGVNYKFSSQENLDIFLKNPVKYVPKYGGYCAYAVAKDGKKVSINPKTFEIRNGELLLFYNSFGINTLEKWKKEGGEDLYKNAELKWSKIKNSN